MKLTVAIVALTLVTAAFAARRAHPALPAASIAFAQNVQVDVGETSTTITIQTPHESQRGSNGF